MTDIKNEYEKLKELIQPQNIADRISVWEDHTKVSAPYNALKQAVTIIRHFETTIESQKEEINNVSLDYCGAIDVLEAKIESLKAITELAVKENEILLLAINNALISLRNQKSDIGHNVHYAILHLSLALPKEPSSEIERLQNGTT